MKKIGLITISLLIAISFSLSAAPPKPANVTIKNSTKKDIVDVYFYDAEKDEDGPNLLKKPLPPGKSIVVPMPSGEIEVYAEIKDKDGESYYADSVLKLKAAGTGMWEIKEDDLYQDEGDSYDYEDDY